MKPKRYLGWLLLAIAALILLVPATIHILDNPLLVIPVAVALLCTIGGTLIVNNAPSHDRKE